MDNSFSDTQMAFTGSEIDWRRIYLNVAIFASSNDEHYDHEDCGRFYDYDGKIVLSNVQHLMVLSRR